MVTYRDTPICPRCGQPCTEYAPWRGWGVDLRENYAVGPDDAAIKLSPGNAIFLWSLIRAKGRWVSRDRLVDELWGTVGRLPSKPHDVISVYASASRKALRPYGVDILNLPERAW